MQHFINSTIVLKVMIAINTLIFLLLSWVHFYWAFGGTLWYAEVLPTNSTGSRRLDPSQTATILIAFGLLFLALITIGNSGIWDKYLNRKYFRFGACLIAIIFILRAIGDFKFIGFFKTIKETPFAVNDTHLFSPLCVFIAVISFLIFTLYKAER